MLNQFRKLFSRNPNLHVPPGHYYSPIPDFDKIEKIDYSDEMKGIQLNVQSQWEVLNELKRFMKDFPFQKSENDSHRYYINNRFFCHSDGFFLYALIRYLQPRKIIEIGSGFSSALMLDINEIFFNNKIELVFIEPFSGRLQSLVKPTDNFKLYECTLQEVNPEIFKTLEKNDILFIDSSHIVKKGSELNYILFNILSDLKEGVKIHFHDLFYPFDYPENWFKKMKIAWNEPYFLRAFLMYNDVFSIFVWNQFLALEYNEWFKANLPFCLENSGGSLWLSKEK